VAPPVSFFLGVLGDKGKGGVGDGKRRESLSILGG